MCAFLAQTFAELLVILLEIQEAVSGPVLMEIMCLFMLMRLLSHCQNVPDDPEHSTDGLQCSLTAG